MNPCTFSPCRRYRYVLHHDWTDLLDSPGGYVAWIGLNPSTADEQQLDPTLRRVRSFTASMGYRRFVMLNLFGLRATDPKVMLAASNRGRARQRPVDPGHLPGCCRGGVLLGVARNAPGPHRARLGSAGSVSLVGA
jgi:hypothetical protein